MFKGIFPLTKEMYEATERGLTKKLGPYASGILAAATLYYLLRGLNNSRNRTNNVNMLQRQGDFTIPINPNINL